MNKAGPRVSFYDFGEHVREWFARAAMQCETWY